MDERLADRFAAEPYNRELGLEVEDLSEGRARIRLPFAEKNSNPGGALHGGVAASLVDIGGALAASTALEGDGWDARVVALSVNYLAAAINEEIVAEGRVLRKGKELTYVEVDVRTVGDKPIAKGLVTHRAVRGEEEPRSFGANPDPEAVAPAEVSSFGKFFMMVPFIRRLGMRNERMEEGMGRVRLPWSKANADGRRAIHEGALAALIDTTGAVASWSVTGPDPGYKASTVGVQASFIERAEGEDAIAMARTLRRVEELFWNDVTVVGAASGKRIAQGTVLYRIVVPR